jgi:hypothetical protein
MLNVIMLNVILLNFVMLNIVMLTVIMLSVVNYPHYLLFKHPYTHSQSKKCLLIANQPNLSTATKLWGFTTAQHYISIELI